MSMYLKTKVSNRDLFDAALGKQKCDKVIKGGRIVNVTSGEILEANVAIKGERIALIGDIEKTIGSQTEIIDATKLYLCPGFMDAHVHVESSFLLPEEYARVVVRAGTTSVFFDPHEIAYVLGMKGIQFMLDRGRNSCIKMFGHITPKLPHLISGGLETYGAEFSESDVIEMLDEEDIVSLGEQTFSKFLRSDRFFNIINRAKSKNVSVEGSAHSLIGEKLNAFISAGIQSDHEATSKLEAEERLRLGIRLMIREGSTERDLKKTIKSLTESHMDSRYVCFCTDDKTVEDLQKEGHIDHCIRKSIKLGLAPMQAYQIASLNAAQYYGLEKEIGSIAPGKISDIVFVESLEECNVRHVMTNGDLVVIDGKINLERKSYHVPDWTLNTIYLKKKLTPENFKIKTRKRDGKALCRVIKTTPYENLTDPIEEWLVVRDGEILPNPETDVLMFSTVERHGKTDGPNIGVGFIKGFGMRRGAIGISVAHDTHNICVLGTNSNDMAAVVNEIARIGGGLAAALEGEIIGSLSLDVAGLISSLPANELTNRLTTIHQKVRHMLGIEIHSPFVAISFHSSSGIPKIKITDKGLVDTVRGEIISVEVDSSG